MKRFIAAVAVACLFTVGASAACEDAAKGANQNAPAAAKSSDGCPAGCCDQGKPCPMAEAAKAAEMPADCPCKKAQQKQQGDATQ